MNLNGALTFADVDYTQLTDYFTVAEGDYFVSLVNSSNGSILVSENVPFRIRTIINIYFAGSSEVSEDRTTMIVAIDIEDEFTPEVDSSASAIGASIITTAVFVALI